MTDSTLRPPRGILFDFCGTILREVSFDLKGGVAAVLEAAHNGAEFNLEDVHRDLRQFVDDMNPRRFGSQLELPPHATHRLFWDLRGLRFEGSLAELELTFWKGAERFSEFPGARQLLSELGARGLPLGVVSNLTFIEQTAAWQLEQYGLRNFFRFIVTSTEYVVRKPHPLIFRAAAQKLGVSSHDIWFVGDSLECDVAGANAAGMTSVWFNADGRKASGYEPHAEVQDWTGLASLLA